MANVLVNENSLTAIGNAIREKAGSSDTYKPIEMANAILGIKTESSSFPTITLTGRQGEYFDTLGAWDDVIAEFSDKIQTKNLTSCLSMFSGSNLERISITVNGQMISTYDNTSLEKMFKECRYLKELPTILCKASAINEMLYSCYCLKYIPDDFFNNINWDYMSTLTSGSAGKSSAMFQNCHSLRSIPVSFLGYMNPKSNYNYCYFYNGFNGCTTLDELVNLPIPYTSSWTSNAFSNSFSYCCRLKELTFATPNGTPTTASWKKQTIDLSTAGFANGYSGTNPMEDMLNYNSGITADKEVTDDATYQALKNDADWFSEDVAYSRYNHDSAVNTINSLPDTSATSAGTNAIKFKGAAGSATDGGAINTLTEEEIAVATAKGWTVSLV